MGLMLLTTTPADVVDLFDDARVDVAVVLCSWFTTDVGRGRHQRLLETVAEFLREGFLRDADAEAAVFGYQVRSEVDGAVEDDGGWLARG